MAGGISRYGKINEQIYFWTINVSTNVSLTRMAMQGPFQSSVPKQQAWSPCTSYAVAWDRIHRHKANL
ncbi:hypothetical protein LB505_004952 [Fusarium chuoi]|nr:hypothetical protein LB505_004952 [Fusarium chuoi]